MGYRQILDSKRFIGLCRKKPRHLAGALLFSASIKAYGRHPYGSRYASCFVWFGWNWGLTCDFWAVLSKDILWMWQVVLYQHFESYFREWSLSESEKGSFLRKTPPSSD
jgi:hypothetical protein